MITLDEAIKHCEEVAHQNEILMKRYDDASGYNRSHNEKIRTNDAKGCEQIISLYRQLAEWLKELKTLKEMLANDIRSCEKILDDKNKNESEHYSARIHKGCCESYLDECIKIKQEEMCKRCRHFVIADGYTETMDGRKIGYWHCELYTIMNIVLDKKCEYEEGEDESDSV